MPTRPKAPPRPPSLNAARQLALDTWLNPTEDGLREARRSLVRRMWQARRANRPDLRAQLRTLYDRVCHAQRTQDWQADHHERASRDRNRNNPSQYAREQVQRQGGVSALLTLHRPGPLWRKTNAAAPASCIFHAPPPGTTAYPEGSPDLVAALRGVKARRTTLGHLPRPSAGHECRIRLTARDHHAAQRAYWRHVANRAALAILADARYPAITARQATSTTTPPHEPPTPTIGSDVFCVRVEPVEITVGGALHQTEPLVLDLHVMPEALTLPARLTLQTFQRQPRRDDQSAEVLFKYRRAGATLERRDGLGGDLIELFEQLLRPHAADLLRALALPT